MEGSGSKRVHLFATCLADAFFPESALAAGEVLEDAGFQVGVDPRQTCCGQPAMNLGHREEARVLALRTMALYEGDMGDEGEQGKDREDREDGEVVEGGQGLPVIVPSGSCAAMMKIHYPELFPEGSRERERAERFALRVQEWSRFLVRAGYRPPRAPGMLSAVTLHPSCHGLRELGVREEPRRLLEQAGYPIVELPRATECCGFGGAFSVRMPEMSGAVLRAKLANIGKAQRGGAGTVASLDAGCLMHMRGGHEAQAGCSEGEKGCPRYRHVSQLLASVVRARSGTGGKGAVRHETQGEG